MTGRELMKRYGMRPHVEQGAFRENHPPHDGDDRAPSGLMYYYVAAGERTAFHRIDCGEYWCYAAGSPLELWQVTDSGAVTVTLLGVEEGCEPVIYVAAGRLFAARSRGEEDGTFLSCITVPRFDASALELVADAEMLRRFPRVEGFYSGISK